MPENRGQRRRPHNVEAIAALASRHGQPRAISRILLGVALARRAACDTLGGNRLAALAQRYEQVAAGGQDVFSQTLHRALDILGRAQPQ